MADNFQNDDFFNGQNTGKNTPQNNFTQGGSVSSPNNSNNSMFGQSADKPQNYYSNNGAGQFQGPAGTTPTQQAQSTNSQNFNVNSTFNSAPQNNPYVNPYAQNANRPQNYPNYNGAGQFQGPNSTAPMQQTQNVNPQAQQVNFNPFKSAQPNRPFANPNMQTAQNPNLQQASTGAVTPNNSGKGQKRTLTENEMNYLTQIGNENYQIKKIAKKYKRASLSENARYLSKVRRLYTAKISSKYYFYPVKQVTELRSNVGDDKKSAAALFGAAARKTRNLIATIIIVISVLAIIGTGSFVTLVVINSDNRGAFNEDGLTFTTSQGSVFQQIDEYTFSSMLNYDVNIINDTNNKITACFYISLEISNDFLAELNAKGIQTTDLSIRYNYDKTSWELRDGKLYNIKQLNASKTEIIPVISGFAIDLAPGKDENIFAGRSMQLVFNIDYSPLS